MKDVAKFTKLLLDSRVELERRLAAIKRDVRNESNPVSRDSGERSVERENDEVIDALGNSAKLELGSISKALSRIDNGDYFDCSECDEPISEGRLLSVPYTSLCVKCAEKSENINRENGNAA